MHFASLTAIAAALASSPLAAAQRGYKLSESYNPSNFWDKWEFFESRLGTNNSGDVDPTHGFVRYQNKSEAARLGLVQNRDGSVYIGAETATSLDPEGYGRKSVRLESKARYNSGLFIADFKYLPPPRCGTWPAFWMYGPNWPRGGEVDIVEQWNDYSFNRQTLHVASPKEVGNCTITQRGMSNVLETKDCWVGAKGQDVNQGCSSRDYAGPFGTFTSGFGGVYATEWTSEAWRLWSWKPAEVPADIAAGAPDPRSWGAPDLQSGGCDVGRAFTDNRLVLNLDFCGDTAANTTEWNRSCRNATGYATCAGWVGAHPEAFTDYYFQIRSINVYQAEGAIVNKANDSSKGLFKVHSSHVRRGNTGHHWRMY